MQRAYPEDSFDNMKTFAAEHGFRFPYVVDESQDVARAYDAVCTPDFFGFDRDLTLAYRGRLDASGRSSDPDGEAGAVRCDGAGRAHRPRAGGSGRLRSAARSSGAQTDDQTTVNAFRKSRNASSTSPGRSAIIAWPVSASVTVCDVCERGDQPLRVARWRHDVARADHHQRRAAHGFARGEAVAHTDDRRGDRRTARRCGFAPAAASYCRASTCRAAWLPPSCRAALNDQPLMSS